MSKCNLSAPNLWHTIRRSFFVGPYKSSDAACRKNTGPKLVLAAIVAITITACGSGGGGGGGGSDSSGGSSTTGSPPSVEFVVSGSVSAPGGAVAFLPRKSLLEQFADAFVSSAYAAITGMAPVADGATIELVRINNAGEVTSVLATTTTSSGGYSFNLTTLALGTASDLVVQVSNSSTGAKMRAFVASESANLDPISETATRIVLETIAATPGLALANFTVQELADITAAVNLLVAVQGLSSGVDIETTVAALKAAVSADAGIMAFIVATSAVGQSSEGSGDIENYVPLTQGNAWVYRGNISTNGVPTVSYTNNASIAGTKVINGVTTVIYAETNSVNPGITSEEYLVEDSSGITIYGSNDASDVLLSQLVPVREYRFPLYAGSSFQPINLSNLNWGADEDGDGVNEQVSVTAQVTVLAFESVTVPAGTYNNCVKIEAKLITIVTFSDDGSTITVVSTVTEWLAPGVGMIKRVTLTQDSQTIFTEVETEELESFTTPPPPVPPLMFHEISAGYDFACGITIEDEAYCWGYGFNGELGSGTAIGSNRPVAVSGSIKFKSIAAGHSHACGIAATGVTYCWGGNFYGQLGNGTTDNSPVPVAVLTSVPFISVSVGRFHACGLTSVGAAYCWGSNFDGQLGHPFPPLPSWPNPTPVPVSGNITFGVISAGGTHTCGLTPNGDAYCWGGNYEWQLGNANSPQSDIPVIVTGGITFTSLETGFDFTCGIATSGITYCWGSNQYGKLGDGTTINSYAPVAVIGGLAFSSITAGDYHMCGVTTNNVAYCWGNNATGAGGNGTTSGTVTVPTAVSGGLSFSLLSAGGEVFTCGTTNGGSGYCWGSNNWGNLGNGTSGNKYVPTAVAPPQ